MDAADLDELLERLRRTRGETSQIEVKAAATDLPDNLHETISAFANTDGGSILLGVAEERGNFHISGVDDPTRVANQLRDVCSHMTPIIRPQIDRVAHPDGVVLAVEVQPVDRRQRPCYLESAGAFAGSYVRVDEGDVQLLPGEVAALLAERSTNDASRNPAPAGTTLDPDAVAAFVASVRASSTRWKGVSEDELLRSRQVVSDGSPTIAGSMALSFDPDRTIPAARIAYRVEPGSDAGDGARFKGDTLAGPVGVLLDDVLDRLRGDLGRLTVSTEQGTEDVYEVPIRSIREIVSNALVHRSYAEGQLDKAALVHVTERAVSVVSPGACYVDVETLGLAPLAGVRNNALVNICQRITTPSGLRICEAQVTGIRFSDQVSREAGVAPPLFLDRPLEFEVVLLRGRLDLAEASARLPVNADAAEKRLLAWAILVDELRDAGRHLHEAALLTATMAARLLAPSSVDEGLARLTGLEERGFLAAQRLGRRTVWAPTGQGRPTVREGGKTTKFERSGLVTMAVHGLGGEAAPAKIAETLGLGSTRTRSQWIGDAVDAGLVEEVGKSTFDPNKVVRLTKSGRAHAAQAERRGSRSS